MRRERNPFVDNSTLFKWRHFEAEIILFCVRWYLRYPLSYRDLEERRQTTRDETATKSDVWLRSVLGEIAVSIARRQGKHKAVWAVAQSIMVIIYHVLSTKHSYQNLGEEYFHRLEAPRLESHHVRQLEQ